MKISFALTVALALLASTAADARGRHHRMHVATGTLAHPDCNVLWPCIGVAPAPYGVKAVQQMGFGTPQQRYTRSRSNSRVQAVVSRRGAGRYAAGYATGLVPVLAAKVAEITSQCSTRLISGVRHTMIAGTRIWSLHTRGEAADLSGDYGCIYAHLHGWPGGYSTDYQRMAHVHVSYSPETGREMGAHFRHGGGYRHYAHRGHRHYAHARHRRYASATR